MLFKLYPPLLTFSLLISACGPPAEIRSDNELGEYVLAKTESLVIEPFLFPEKKKRDLYADLSETYQEYSRCSQGILGSGRCADIYLSGSYKEKLGRYNELVELEKSLPRKLDKPAVKMLKWRGIAKAVGSERAKVERVAYCFDPNLTPELRGKWESLTERRHPSPDDKNRDDLFQKVEFSLCKEFSKF